MFKKVCLFSGNANPKLAAEIANYLETPLGKVKVQRFSDGETFCEINENVRGVDAFVIQPTSSPVNDHVMELLIMADTLRRASAQTITAVTADTLVVFVGVTEGTSDFAVLSGSGYVACSYPKFGVVRAACGKRDRCGLGDCLDADSGEGDPLAVGQTRSRCTGAAV